jgi:hypothetical protein
MARITEDDVRAGKLVAENAKLRLRVNQATGVRTLRFEANANADGQPLKRGPAAELAAVIGPVGRFQQGVLLFTDRTYRALEPPADLKGKRLLRDSIDRSSFTCKRPGMVYVLTPAKSRNRDSVVDQLLEQGFEKVRMKEFLLFGNIPGNICTVYQMGLERDACIQFDKWGVVVW